MIHQVTTSSSAKFSFAGLERRSWRRQTAGVSFQISCGRRLWRRLVPSRWRKTRQVARVASKDVRRKRPDAMMQSRMRQRTPSTST